MSYKPIFEGNKEFFTKEMLDLFPEHQDHTVVSLTSAYDCALEYIICVQCGMKEIGRRYFSNLYRT